MVSKQSINKPELVAYHVLKSAAAHFNEKPANLTAEQRKTVSQTALKSYELEHKILSSDEAQDIVIPPQSIVVALEEMESRYESSEEFLQDLKANGLSYDTIRFSIRRELWVEAVLDRICADIAEVDEAEVIQFYQKNQHKFQTQEKRTVRHLLITLNNDYKENTLSVVQQRLQKLIDQLVEGGDFAKLAAENSECPTAMNGGEVGTVSRGQLYPEIDDVLFEMEAGDFAGPVQTEIGFHLVKCEEVIPGTQASLFEAKAQIANYLLEKKRVHRQRLWLQQLETKK